MDKSIDEKSLSVIIPAFNEERMIEVTIESVLDGVKSLNLDYEIIVVNDGSSDNTKAIVDEQMRDKPNIRLINNPHNRGLGYSLKEGFRTAIKDHVTWFPGDHSVARQSLKVMWESIGSADIIISYMENILQRSFKRKILSLTFTRLINLIFRLNVRYYNGLFIFPTQLVRSLKLSGQGHDIFCEMIVRSLKLGYSYREVPFIHKIESERDSKAINMRNVRSILRVIAILINDIYIRKQPRG